MKKASVFLILASIYLATTSSGNILINEVLVNPGGVAGDSDDDNFEFIELISTTGGSESVADLTLVVLDSTGGNIGEIEEAWGLGGLTTGANGLLLLGNGYPTEVPHPGVAAETVLADPTAPSGMGNSDIGNNDGFTLLLVRGFSGTPGDDIDVGNDGTLDSAPWSEIVDSVGFDDRGELGKQTFALADLTTSYDPDLLARRPGNVAANSAGAWFGGEILGENPLNVGIDPTKRFGTSGLVDPVVTPGQPNESFELANLLINEVHINPPGGDGSFEYIEILNADGGVAATQGYTLLVINTEQLLASDPTCALQHRTPGAIVEAWDLAGFSTGANGLLMLGNGFASNDKDDTPWGDAIGLGTSLGEPGGLGGGNVGNQVAVREGGVCKADRSNSGFTLMLVTNFRGALGQDLDGNDDFVLDASPWGQIKDSIGYDKLNLAQNDSATQTYSAADVTPVDAFPNGFEPDNVSRKFGDLTPNSASAWYGGEIGGTNSTSTNFSATSIFGDFRGRATPGAENVAAVPTPGSLILSEVHMDPPGNDNSAANNTEFIELRNPEGILTGGQGYHLLVVNPNGEVPEVWDLGGLSTGSNGILVLGDFDAGLPYDIVAGEQISDPLSNLEDPDGFTTGDLPDGAFSLLLVTGFSEGVGVDLDSNDDGQFDDDLGFTVVDSIGTGVVDDGVADLGQSGWAPDSVSRLPGNDSVNSAAAWVGGEVVGTSANVTSLEYSAENYFGAFRGGVSPARLNHGAEPRADLILINELNINPPGGDDNFEYIEIISTALAGQSTNRLTLLLIDTSGGGDGTGNTGTVIEAWSLDGLGTGGNGLLLLGNGYDLEPVGGPFSSVIDGLTTTGDPEWLGNGNLVDNGALGLLLVRGFTGTRLIDLDGEPSPDDGILSSPVPWAALVDSVGFGDRIYGAANIGADAGATWNPDNASRVGNVANMNPSTTSDWFAGSLSGLTGTSLNYSTTESFDRSGRVAVGLRMATPGSHNPGGSLDDLVDNDSDGHVNLLEDALNTNRDVPDVVLFPMAAVAEVGGED
ncbi:MAG: hypothetical protein P8J87_19990, partial [Verrucomicrobiales bacterium]|nr:hypothetical protein [Verrucomicrobiales bacterium]